MKAIHLTTLLAIAVVGTGTTLAQNGPGRRGAGGPREGGPACESPADCRGPQAGKGARKGQRKGAGDGQGQRARKRQGNQGGNGRGRGKGRGRGNGDCQRNC